MSSVNNYSGTLVIYQSGLGGTQYDFYKTIEKLVGSNPYRHKAFVVSDNLENSYLNAGVTWQGESLLSHPSNTSNLRTKLDKLVEYCSRYPHHHVHVRTRLGGAEGFDSIEKQTACLCSIIEYLESKSDFDRKIVLVGHSQGGLVNLETAILRPESIDKIISLSTPYNPVDIGKDVMTIFHLGELFKYDVNGKIRNELNVTADEAQKFRDRIETLSSSSYFSDLKNRWANCVHKPKLYVISGTSGRLAHTYYVYTSNGYAMPVTIKKSFDGLVTTKEQHDIPYNGYQPFVDLDIECLRRQDNWWAGNYQGDCKNCGIFTSTCDLPVLNVTNVAMKALLEGISNFLRGNGFTFDQYARELSATISAAAYPDYANDRYFPKNNPYPQYQQYYDIYSHRYSHGWIRYDDLAVFCIRSYIE